MALFLVQHFETATARPSRRAPLLIEAEDSEAAYTRLAALPALPEGEYRTMTAAPLLVVR
jgi:hypothetical protein